MTAYQFNRFFKCSRYKTQSGYLGKYYSFDGEILGSRYDDPIADCYSCDVRKFRRNS